MDHFGVYGGNAGGYFGGYAASRASLAGTRGLFPLNVDQSKQPGLCDWWPRVDNFYGMVIDYYKNSSSGTCYQEDEDCDNEEE